MGINPGMLDLFVEWFRDYGILRGAEFLDIGTSQLFCEDDPDSLNRFLRHFGAEPYVGEELTRMANKSLAAPLFHRAGLGYDAIDITPYPHTIRVDLNTGRLPLRKRGRYTFVANSGTTEHVLNQYNAFKIIHDATRINGLMYHGVPMSGDFAHGLLSYRPRLFTRLAEANAYEVVSRWLWAGEMRPYEEVEDATFNRHFAAQDAWAHFLLRRKSKAAFRPPLDCLP
jgi:hypothetical protein